MKKVSWGVAVAALLLSSAAPAADRFIGVGIGSTDIDDSTTIAGTRVAMDDTALGWKVYGGMMLTRNFGFEAGWVDLGDMNHGGVDLETEGFMVAGIAALPVGKSLNLYAKAGVFFWDQDINTVSYDGEDLMYGIGARVRFMDQFHARIEYEVFDTRIESSLISVGVGLQF
ncbi:MAG: outer membrane beta-barrel protein [Thiohalobacteraceae bacterium]